MASFPLLFFYSLHGEKSQPPDGLKKENGMQKEENKKVLFNIRKFCGLTAYKREKKNVEAWNLLQKETEEICCTLRINYL